MKKVCGGGLLHYGMRRRRPSLPRLEVGSAQWGWVVVLCTAGQARGGLEQVVTAMSDSWDGRRSAVSLAVRTELLGRDGTNEMCTRTNV